MKSMFFQQFPEKHEEGYLGGKLKYGEKKQCFLNVKKLAKKLHQGLARRNLQLATFFKVFYKGI